MTYIIFNEEVYCLGDADAFEGTFYIQCGKYSYQVDYNTPFSGVVLYTVKEVQTHSAEPYRVYVPKEEKQENLSINPMLSPVITASHPALPSFNPGSAAFLLGCFLPTEVALSGDPSFVP